jgi:predicted amidohydrolase
MSEIKLRKISQWCPHPRALPEICRNDAGQLLIAANGTATCSGGWHLLYDGIEPGRNYEIRIKADFENIGNLRDNLEAIVYWDEIPENGYKASSCIIWNYLQPVYVGEQLEYNGSFNAPETASRLTVQLTFRWSKTGKSIWSVPEISEIPQQPSAKAVKICAASGNTELRWSREWSIADNINYYRVLCETIYEEAGPDLIVLPEITLQWQVPGHQLDIAVPVDGKETEPFRELAVRCKTRILLGMLEKEDDAVYNSAVLLSDKGNIEGIYRKVHLATGEDSSGTLPGSTFPVFNTAIGRIGCNICMDSSVAESSRMAGINGAEFLLLPIMGDLRASRWNPGQPEFNESRWKAIMRTRALDNQLCMVVTRNNAKGSCVIDRKGDILAWNDGSRDFVYAMVERNDGFRCQTGGCFREITWKQRRPHLYSALSNEEIPYDKQ